MFKKILFALFFILVSGMHAQEKKHQLAMGFNYGFGSEFNNTDYTYTNHYYKLQLYYVLNKTRNFTYEILLQPEINFATHQLLNPYFITPDTPNYEEKIAEYMKLKSIREYVMNVGFLVRKPLSRAFSMYVLASVGPMITDRETERLSEGFAFSDVFSVGLSLKIGKVILDFRPNIRHTSNAGLKSSNAGFNTRNIEFVVAIPL